MGKAVIAREQRRETKRTLGRQLEEFASNHIARLQKLDESIHAAEVHIGAERTHRLKMAEEQRSYVDSAYARTLFARELVKRGFFGRLTWLVTGK